MRPHWNFKIKAGVRALAKRLGAQLVFAIFRIFPHKIDTNTLRTHTNALEIIINSLGQDHKIYLPYITSHKKRGNKTDHKALDLVHEANCD